MALGCAPLYIRMAAFLSAVSPNVSCGSWYLNMIRPTLSRLFSWNYTRACRCLRVSCEKLHHSCSCGCLNRGSLLILLYHIISPIFRRKFFAKYLMYTLLLSYFSTRTLVV
ncbi:hypothetical protein PUN28_010651 [Cardiocondyla obscurior]|uniref:Secreted protein n=1 Tax=Cardiocondyla obscurior TaxID=286306 RepID=A0AAW2FKH6_9HYME